MDTNFPAKPSAYSSAIASLRQVLAESGADSEIGGIISRRDDVISRFRPIFAPEHVPHLTGEEFRGFLQFENNHHWTGINRWGTIVSNRMDVLRGTLAMLLDESIPIRERMDAILNRDGLSRISGLGKAVVTPILLVSNPDQYGVWNQPTESGMKRLGIWPVDEPGLSQGDTYERVNRMLHRIAGDLGVDLWTLDALWWGIAGRPITGTGQEPAYTEDDFEEAVRTLEELDELAPLDERREVSMRVEQGFIRQQLFGGKRELQCVICGRSFPTELVRAAHIKRRADCSSAEKRDYQNNVVPMCTLGCDELFERGYVVVRDGSVQKGRKVASTPAVEDYIAQIVDRLCLSYYRGSDLYFNWHSQAYD